MWQFDWYVDSDDLQPSNNALFLLQALSLPSALITHAGVHDAMRFPARRADAARRGCAFETALRCILHGRCMSHDRCSFHGVRQVYARMQGGPTLPDAMHSSSADRSAVLDEYGIRIQEL